MVEGCKFQFPTRKMLTYIRMASRVSEGVAASRPGCGNNGCGGHHPESHGLRRHRRTAGRDRALHGLYTHGDLRGPGYISPSKF